MCIYHRFHIWYALVANFSYLCFEVFTEWWIEPKDLLFSLRIALISSCIFLEYQLMVIYPAFLVLLDKCVAIS